MIKNIIGFYYNPYSYFFLGKKERFKEKILLLRKAFILCFLSSFFIVLIITLIIESILKAQFDLSISENLRTNRNEFKIVNSHLESFFKICLLGPFEEEVLFRLPLIKKNKFLLMVVILGWIDYLFPELFHLKFFSIEYNVIIFLILIGLFFNSQIPFKAELTNLEKGSYNYLCWVLILAFGFFHIGNFAPLNWYLIYLYPIYVLPQIIYGVVMSYLTIRYNSILWSFLLHVAINSTSEIYRIIDLLIN
ncbi:CPBP family glutamic-type intramembrane protease [Dyadobacter frigoris]|uniref:CPBP family intramembrane metalloprotease n=1 Tax=Dyadobacter frigoris TaxID=2576211 RepID=A0A4V6BJ61_9BACT|nr:CPBP family glutamic-type intramembrane protease [Dyadobacter frigoris]TKT93093.1 CPBP family intramembrane metalloprotease [Dyadobacter frigoris]